ncbi:MAG: DUF2442 domain-containing protein [Psychroflexus sp.]
MKYTEIKITKAEALTPYQIKVTFNDNTIKTIDLEPILYGAYFESLRNPELFKRIRVNQEIQTIEWPNGADFHPETLYNWENYKDELIEKAKSWEHPKTV